MKRYQSWGRYPPADQTIRKFYWRSDEWNLQGETRPVLPYGLGRSYGDCCLNDGGVLLDCTGLDRFIFFDGETGLFRCEAGASLDDILKLILPKGWFLPVTPGTRYVTVGGAIANDVHGKNHHQSGTFGAHLTRFELLRTNGERYICTPTQNSDLFQATIGGLGLTGIILWAEFQLKKIRTPFIDTEIIKFANLEEFYEISRPSDDSHEYTVAWIDSMAKEPFLGRGLFIRGNHAKMPTNARPSPREKRIRIIADAPGFLLNRATISLFNFLYYNKQRKKISGTLVHCMPFFYPLDAITDWNRLYGKSGFFQYQCLVPADGKQDVVSTILKTISAAGLGSFLSVLKAFGSGKSPGLISFPRKGITLALDFPNKGEKTFSLMDRLDSIVRDAGGAVYPAKDARMSAESFRAFFPHWEELVPYLDPNISSSFSRRVLI